MFLVDSIMLGSLGREAIAAVGIAGPFVYTFISVVTALAVGTMAIVARAVGERDAAKQERESATSLVTAFVVGILLVILSSPLLPHVAQFFKVGDSEEVVRNATIYLQIYAYAFPFLLMELVASNIMRAGGETKIPMYLAFVSNALNIVLNYFLIFGAWGFPELGVAGAAIATMISSSLQGVLAVAVLFTKWSPIRLRMGSLRLIDWGSFKKLIKISLPAAVEPMIFQTGMLTVVKLITELGTVSLAAHRAAISIESLSFMPAYGFATACSAIIGQALGAKLTRRAEEGFHQTARLMLWFMYAIGAIFFCFSTFLIWLFIPNDPEVIGLGASCLAIAAFEQPFMGLAMVYGGALRGAGDTKSPVYVSIVGIWGVRIPLAYIMAHVLCWGIVGIWMVMVADWLSRTLVYMYLYNRGKWKHIVL